MAPKEKSKYPIEFRFEGQTISFEALWDRLRNAIDRLEPTRRRIADQIPRIRGVSGPNEATQYSSKQQNLLDAARRYEEADDIRNAQARYEDFLYFQNPIHRRRRPLDLENRNVELQLFKRKERKPGDKRWRPSMIMDSLDADYHMRLLQEYEKYRIGEPLYRVTHVPGDTGEMRNVELLPLGPDSTHQFTPWYRYPLSGLSLLNTAELFRSRLGELNVPDIDELALEQRRSLIESRVLEPGLGYKTHTERRQREMRDYENSHPDSTHVGQRKNEDALVHDDSFQRIRTSTGLFVAARETSRDWLTSYDCLGPVNSANFPAHFETSAIREEDMIYGEEEEEDELDSEEEVVENPARQNAKKRGRPVLTKVSQPPKKKTKEAKKSTRGGRIMYADIDYPYPKAEFLQKRSLQVDDEFLTSTEWAEAADGRRERQVAIASPPCSPVLSPPRSPIRPNTIEERTIPDPCDDHEFPEDGIKTKRCQHDTPKCRAWWNHTRDECWIVYEEETMLPTDTLEIPVPDFAKKQHGVLHIPQDKRETYRHRLHDHYGRLAAAGDQKWPRIGIRVPYEPTTFADFDRTQEAQADQSHDISPKKALKGWQTLAMPLIPPQQPWDTDPDSRYPSDTQVTKPSGTTHQAASQTTPQTRATQHDVPSIPEAQGDTGDGHGGDDNDDDGDKESVLDGDEFHSAYLRASGSAN